MRVTFPDDFPNELHKCRDGRRLAAAFADCPGLRAVIVNGNSTGSPSRTVQSCCALVAARIHVWLVWQAVN